MIWLDQGVKDQRLEVTLRLESGSGGFQPLSLIPVVRPGARLLATGLDTPTTYPEGGEPSWNQDAGGWTTATTSVTRHSDGSGSELVIRVEPASREANPAPFCLLMDKAQLVDARLVADSDGASAQREHSPLSNGKTRGTRGPALNAPRDWRYGRA